MAYTYHGTQGWVKQPNRIVKTFDSGLCLIQQDYIRRKDKVEYFTFKEGDALSVVDSQPCIDGAFIFPEPDYSDMGNGYIKCTVTAYGRVNNTGTVTTRKQAVYLIANVSEEILGIAYNNNTLVCQTAYSEPPGSFVIAGAPGSIRSSLPLLLYGGSPDSGLIDIPVLKIVLGAEESPSTIIPPNLVNIFVGATGENITNKLFFPEIRGFNQSNSIPASFGADFEGRKLSAQFAIDQVATTDYGRFKEYTISWKITGSPEVDLGTFIRKGTWSPFTFPETTITAFSIGSTGFTFTGGANYAVNQSFCVLQQLAVNKTDVIIKQGASTITSFSVADAVTRNRAVTGLTANTTYAISVTCANNYYQATESLQVTTISA
jgi:hypothetical protein